MQIGTPLSPSATRVMLLGSGIDAAGIRYEDIDKALAVPNSELRLFGEPTSYRRRRMGVALATADSTDEARARANQCASGVRPQA